MRVNITLEHKESGERLYLTSKNKRNTPDRLQLKKYSPKLRKHVVFTEVKQWVITFQQKRKNLDLTRFLNFPISMYCNKNQPNDYTFDYIFCEINQMFGYIENALVIFVLIPKSQTINLSKGFSSVLHRTKSFSTICQVYQGI